MRRRVREEAQESQWPPEHLRHYRPEDWPNRIDSPDVSADECARCAYWKAHMEWLEDWLASHPDDPRDPLACCPAWPDCGFTPPDDYFHRELI